MALSDRVLLAKLLCSEADVGDNLKCSACSHIAVNCFQTCHGCRLCQYCVASKLDTTKRRICPCTPGPISIRDEEEIKELLVNQASCLPDTATRRDVSKLIVRCPNSQCPAQLEWKSVEKHLNDSCSFEFHTCRLCDRQVVRRELRTACHYNLNSEDCCTKYSGPCPLCGECLSREKFVEHENSCSERPIECKYRGFGCTEVTSCIQMNEHYKDSTDKHLQMVIGYLFGNGVMDEPQADQLNAMRHLQELVQKEVDHKLKADLQKLVQKEVDHKLKADLQELVQKEVDHKLKADLQELVQKEVDHKLKADLQELVQKKKRQRSRSTRHHESGNSLDESAEHQERAACSIKAAHELSNTRRQRTCSTTLF